MQKFPLGRVAATPAALYELERLGINPLELLGRHVSLDPGALGSADRQANERALLDGSRVFSAYEYTAIKFFVITGWDRSATTILLASEY